MTLYHPNLGYDSAMITLNVIEEGSGIPKQPSSPKPPPPPPPPPPRPKTS